MSIVLSFASLPDSDFRSLLQSYGQTSSEIINQLELHDNYRHLRDHMYSPEWKAFDYFFNHIDPTHQDIGKLLLRGEEFGDGAFDIHYYFIPSKELLSILQRMLTITPNELLAALNTPQAELITNNKFETPNEVQAIKQWYKTMLEEFQNVVYARKTLIISVG